jgi:hypothetical protein
MLESGVNKRFGILKILACACVIACTAFAFDASALAQVSQRDLDALSKASVIFIATVRKDGNQSTPAPVWFTVAPEQIVLIQTRPTSWKAKRIRRGSPAIVWIGSQSGPAFTAKAQISSDPTVLQRIIDDFPHRYLMARLGFHKPTHERFDKGEIVAIKLTPVRDLPEGFASSPGTPAPHLEAEKVGMIHSAEQH